VGPTIRPTQVCQALLAALEASGGQRKRRKRDQTPDAIGLAVKRELLERAVDRFALSARAHHRIRRVARTIADLAGEDIVSTPHMAEALSLRQLS